MSVIVVEKSCLSVCVYVLCECVSVCLYVYLSVCGCVIHVKPHQFVCLRGRDFVPIRVSALSKE